MFCELSVALLALLLGQFAREFLGGGAQFLHQLANFLVAGAAIQRFAQLLLGGAQIALGLRGVAVLDLQRHRPKEIGDADEVLDRLRARRAASAPTLRPR